MSKNRILFTLSIILALLPSLGFSKSWEDQIIVIVGLILFVLAYMYIKDSRMAPGTHIIHSEAKKYFDKEGDYVGGEIDVTEEVVIDRAHEEEG